MSTRFGARTDPYRLAPSCPSLILGTPRAMPPSSLPCPTAAVHPALMPAKRAQRVAERVSPGRAYLMSQFSSHASRKNKARPPWRRSTNPRRRYAPGDGRTLPLRTSATPPGFPRASDALQRPDEGRVRYPPPPRSPGPTIRPRRRVHDDSPIQAPDAAVAGHRTRGFSFASAFRFSRALIGRPGSV